MHGRAATEAVGPLRERLATRRNQRVHTPLA